MDKCEHVAGVDVTMLGATEVCEDCVRLGDTWVQLRVCKTCGYVGCCDSSKNRHARAHSEQTGHPIIGPARAEGWLWCYPHDAYVEPDGTYG